MPPTKPASDAPTLVVAIAATGFAATMVGAATVMAATLIPAIAIWIGRPPKRPDATCWPRHSGYLPYMSRISPPSPLTQTMLSCFAASA